MLEFAARAQLGEFRLDLRFEGPSDGVTALFGASGAGKTSALALLAGMLRPQQGRIVLDGRVLLDVAAGCDVPMEERRIGWVFQDGRLFPHLTVAANLDYGARRVRGGGQAARIDRGQVIDVLGIAGLLGRRPRELSGGERQRVALGRALLARPALLLLDEPLAALDTPRRTEILEFIERVKREFRVPMVYVTHSIAEVVRLADHLVLLEHGMALAAGTVHELFGRADVPLLAGRADAGALIEGEVVSCEHGAALVRAGEELVSVSTPALPAGSRLRAFVLASDVILASERPRRLSVRNVFECRVGAVAPQPDGSMLVELDCRGMRLLAAVTSEAALEMQLGAGAQVFALVKSVAIDAPAGRRLLDAGG
jgi:molybdate transport system ATP-binding protein